MHVELWSMIGKRPLKLNHNDEIFTCKFHDLRKEKRAIFSRSIQGCTKEILNKHSKEVTDLSLRRISNETTSLAIIGKKFHSKTLNDARLKP